MSDRSAREPQRRSTAQKRALTAALDGSDRFMTAPELHALLVGSGHQIGLATVYKQLSQLAADSELDVLRTDTGENLYRSCGTPQHHHHLVCRQCGRTVEIEAPEVEAWTRAMAKRAGYSDITHTVEVAGVCRQCRRKATLAGTVAS